MVKDFRSISSQKLEWQIITPNEKADWINQRDGVFDNLIPLAPEKKFAKEQNSIFCGYSLGVGTNKDSWLYNSSIQELCNNANSMIDYYNQERQRFHCSNRNLSIKAKDVVSFDSTKIAWTDMFLTDIERNIEYSFRQENITNGLYRPYFKQRLLFQKRLIQRTYQQLKFFPTTQYANLQICVSGIGSHKDFSIIITDCIPDLQLQFNGQCFPLYWYEENKNPQATLFDDEETGKYIRRDGITDWILKEVRSRFGGSKAITKEHIFYYVYGLLHSKQYRERFADDLKKSLPRIPIVDNVQDFMSFYKAGKELADLHLNYEQGINEQAVGQDGDYLFFAVMPMLAHRACGVDVNGDMDIWQNNWTNETYQHFAVDKMRFAKIRDENGKLVADKARIIYNDHITIENIPLKAYEYVVNGKSAIEWIMERYALTIDKASQIKNDPNDWSREHEQPRYILDLLLSVIMLSCQTVDIVNTLPILRF